MTYFVFKDNDLRVLSDWILEAAREVSDVRGISAFTPVVLGYRLASGEIEKIEMTGRRAR